MVYEIAYSTSSLVDFSKGTGTLPFPQGLPQSLYRTFINCVSVQSSAQAGTTYYITSSASTYKANDGTVHPNVLASFVSSLSLYHFPKVPLCSLSVIPETLIFHACKLDGHGNLVKDETYEGKLLVQLTGFKV